MTSMNFEVKSRDCGQSFILPVFNDTSLNVCIYMCIYEYVYIQLCMYVCVVCIRLYEPTYPVLSMSITSFTENNFV